MYAPSPASTDPARKPMSLPRLIAMHAAGEKIAMLTCYDASFAALCDRAGVDVLLVGDSLGMVLQGEASTLPVTIEHMRYHVACVARGLANARGSAWVIGDLPFASYQASCEAAYQSAALLMCAGANMVKLEGAGHDNGWLFETIRFLVARGIPVCAHLGLTPQSVHQLGGYRLQAKTDDAAKRLCADAASVEEAGAQMLVLEMVPSALAARVTSESGIPVIGIGAGPHCSGQVLVLHDMLGIFPGRKARFVKNFMVPEPGAQHEHEHEHEHQHGIDAAVNAYVQAVKEGSFPGPEHAYG